jgi:hypothetical protein
LWQFALFKKIERIQSPGLEWQVFPGSYVTADKLIAQAFKRILLQIEANSTIVFSYGEIKQAAITFETDGWHGPFGSNTVQQVHASLRIVD